MNAFLSDATRHLIQTQGLTNLAAHTIVVPTRRAMLVVKECFRDYMRANGLQGPVQLPELTTLSQLFDDLSPRYKADELFLVCTLHKVLLSFDLPLSTFNLSIAYGWLRQLVQDFSNIDKAYPLVTPEACMAMTSICPSQMTAKPFSPMLFLAKLRP